MNYFQHPFFEALDEEEDEDDTSDDEADPTKKLLRLVTNDFDEVFFIGNI